MTRSLPHPMSATQRASAVDELGQLAQGGGAAPIPVIGLDACSADAQGIGVRDVTALAYLRVGTTDADIEIVAAFLAGGRNSNHGASVRLRAAPRQCDRPPD